MPSKHDVGVDDTLPPDDAEGPVLPGGGPPVDRWDRYELLDLLGKGGMGSVYRARDRRLDRTVAIKFLLGADVNLTMRFLREARAQARIDHPHICRVYEVGEVQGRAYIALQLIDGEPLHKAAARMSLDEKIAVLRDVAEAIQEAHRLGIVHRDLKPANIMVERTGDGRWFPIVMDFGLAREATVEAGITESGALLGTPAYMSPEQARGDVHAVDRRSDVYSLGATLYELLTGRPPFPAASLAQALALVIHDDPTAPRSLVRSVPIDLETIALKCLAKDPAQRYPSARALADDLGRYLAGEPILGRRLSRWQRLRVLARRNRALVVLGAWSLAIIVAVASLGVRAWIISRRERDISRQEIARSAERARLAERLGRETTNIESDLREAYLWPLHDTRPDREAVRERMRAIAATRHDLGTLGQAVIHDALGRGYLALHKWREADEEFAQAAALGPQPPELHLARGRALGELYHRAIEEARRSGDANNQAWFARRQQELERQYLEPARAELEQGRTSEEDATLLDAQIALYRRDFAAAEKQAIGVAKLSPGSSDARKLAADAAYAAGIEAFDHGDYDVARLKLERATTWYAEASEIARSDASVYEAAAETWLARAEVDDRQGRSPREPLERALELIDDRALSADPDDASAYTTKVYVLLRRSRRLSPEEQDEKPSLLDRMAQAGMRAIKTDRHDANAWTALGTAHLYRGIYESDNGGECGPWYNRAIEAFGHALAIRPDDPSANNALGTAHRWLGHDAYRAGRDPTPEYQLALRSYAQATAVASQYLPACTNQVEIHTSIADYDDEIGSDPRPAVDNALREGQRCLAIDPNYFLVLENLARAQLALAHYLVENRNDPTDALASARGYLDREETIHPGHMAVRYFRGFAAGTEAAFRLQQGADPTISVAAGRAALKEALALALRNPSGSALSYVETARLDLVEAARAGSGATALLARARADAATAIALDEHLAAAKLTAAEACLQLAKAQPSRAIVDSGIAYATQALELSPRLSRAPRVLDELSHLPMPAGGPGRPTPSIR